MPTERVTDDGCFRSTALEVFNVRAQKLARYAAFPFSDISFPTSIRSAELSFGGDHVK
jgi:hypothetical protein